jgi:hypothetical protein
VDEESYDEEEEEYTFEERLEMLEARVEEMWRIGRVMYRKLSKVDRRGVRRRVRVRHR